MLNIQDAIKLYEERYPNNEIISALDVGDEWVLGARDKESGYELDVSPIAVSKTTGAFRAFFPPANTDKLKNAVVLNLFKQE